MYFFFFFFHEQSANRAICCIPCHRPTRVTLFISTPTPEEYSHYTVYRGFPVVSSFYSHVSRCTRTLVGSPSDSSRRIEALDAEKDSSRLCCFFYTKNPSFSADSRSLLSNRCVFVSVWFFIIHPIPSVGEVTEFCQTFPHRKCE